MPKKESPPKVIPNIVPKVRNVEDKEEEGNETDEYGVSKLDIASLDMAANLKTMTKDQLRNYIKVMKAKMKFFLCSNLKANSQRRNSNQN